MMMLTREMNLWAKATTGSLRKTTPDDPNRRCLLMVYLTSDQKFLSHKKKVNQHESNEIDDLFVLRIYDSIRKFLIRITFSILSQTSTIQVKKNFSRDQIGLCLRQSSNNEKEEFSDLARSSSSPRTNLSHHIAPKADLFPKTKGDVEKREEKGEISI